MTTTRYATEQLTAFLDGLFGVDSISKPVDPPSPIDSPRVLATYNDMDGGFRFAITCELKLANSLGAALTMIPPGGAEDATAAGEVPDNIGENVYEVLNICSAVFADHEGQRIILDKVILPGQTPDEEIVGKIDEASTLLQVEYSLPRYQAGNISLLQITP